MVKEFIFGLIIENMKEIGVKIKCMVKEKQDGQMEKCMKAIIWMIKNTEKVFFNGQMAENIQDTGQKVNKMVLEHIYWLAVKKKLANGKMAKE